MQLSAFSGCNSEQEGSFQVRYLSGQVSMNSNGALVKADRTNFQTPRGCYHARNALGVFKTFNRSLKRRVQVKQVAVNQCMPMQDSCPLWCLQPVSPDLVCKKSRPCFRHANRILTPFTTPANKTFPSAFIHALIVSLVAVRILLIAASEKPLSWTEYHSTTMQSA